MAESKFEDTVKNLLKTPPRPHKGGDEDDRPKGEQKPKKDEKDP